VPNPPATGNPVPTPPTTGSPAPNPPTTGNPVPTPPTTGSPAPNPPTAGNPVPTPPTSTTPTPSPPSGTGTSPSPIESVTTTETISQVQIAGCLSHCQGTDEVQQATQETVTVQAVGTAAQLAAELESAPAQAPSTPAAGAVTQIQLGCVSYCSGDTSTSSSTSGLAEQLMSALGSLAQTADPSPASEAAAIEQLACQLQGGQGGGGAQVQTATQSSTTVQVTATAPTQPATVGSTPGPVADTGQQTWQLQIGCLFYCTDSEQVQEAQQTSTTIQAVPGSSGSSGTVAVVSQVVWQIQIGCLAWCYDSTQVQEASRQSTVVVLTAPPPAPANPAPPAPADPTPPAPAPVSPSPAPASNGEPQQAPAAEQSVAPPASASVPPPVAEIPQTSTRTAASMRRAGLAIFDSGAIVTAIARAAPARAFKVARVAARASYVPVSMTRTVHASPPRHRRAPGTHHPRIGVVKAQLAHAASASRDGVLVAMLLALVGGFVVLVVRRRR
jgi:hypothetical protein